MKVVARTNLTQNDITPMTWATLLLLEARDTMTNNTLQGVAESFPQVASRQSSLPSRRNLVGEICRLLCSGGPGMSSAHLDWETVADERLTVCPEGCRLSEKVFDASILRKSDIANLRCSLVWLEARLLYSVMQDCQRIYTNPRKKATPKAGPPGHLANCNQAGGDAVRMQEVRCRDFLAEGLKQWQDVMQQFSLVAVRPFCSLCLVIRKELASAAFLWRLTRGKGIQSTATYFMLFFSQLVLRAPGGWITIFSTTPTDVRGFNFYHWSQITSWTLNLPPEKSDFFSFFRGDGNPEPKSHGFFFFARVFTQQVLTGMSMEVSN